ncbi:MAG: hypothetical protein M1831_001771 [Alyxoria varia]|nr:MAG: hypothetical protein M1831_001771 [Alyxoria varia]
MACSKQSQAKSTPGTQNKQKSFLTPDTGRSTRSRNSSAKETEFVTGSDLSSDDAAGSGNGQSQSGYDESEGAEESALSDLGSNQQEEEDENNASDRPSKRRKTGTPQKKKSSASVKPAVKAKKGEELWRHGVKTGLGPGVKVEIEKPQARSAGKTPYKDSTIHPNTMEFLGDLAKNNDREWLKRHDPDYRQSLNDWNTFAERISEKIIEADETVPELPLKDITFRIYRDIRFSPDPTPYKAQFSGAWSRTGRKGPFAVYYVQIRPGGNIIAGGLYMPDSGQLAAIRDNIDRHPQQIKQVLQSPGLRKEFFGGIRADADKAVDAFIKHNKESALKTKPKGYDADHENIELLRLKNFTVFRSMSDKEVMKPDFIDKVASLIQCMVPFVTFLNSVVMPD